MSTLRQWCRKNPGAKNALDNLFRGTIYSFDNPRNFENLERIYSVCEKAWNRNLRRLRGQRIRYLLIAEAAPWTDPLKPPSYFYENLAGNWCKRITRVFGIENNNHEVALNELANRGFVLVDSLPFAAPYTSQLRNKHPYLELIRACRPYFEDKLHELKFDKDVKIAFAFNLNGHRLIEAYEQRLPIRGSANIEITDNQIAADGSGYTNEEELKRLFCLPNRRSLEIADKLPQNRSRTRILEGLVKRIRREKMLTNEVPSFDPTNGNEKAKFLLLLEAPGGKAVKSGFVSLDNRDQTASNLKDQLRKASIDRSEIVIWNVVPWYLGNHRRIRAAVARDVEDGLKYLDILLGKLKRLKCIVLVGGAARKAHIHLSHTTTAKVRILSCFHPSPKVINNAPTAAKENIKVFKAMKRYS